MSLFAPRHRWLHLIVCAVFIGVVVALPRAWNAGETLALVLVPLVLVAALLWILNNSDAKNFR